MDDPRAGPMSAPHPTMPGGQGRYSGRGPTGAAAGAVPLVIHRILADDSATGFTTKGDHNAYMDPWHPTRADVVGTPAHVLPGVGPAIGFLRAPIVAASIASVIAMAWLVSAARRMPPAVEAGQRETAAL